jgi:phosphoribosylformylglycinamidine synthase
MSMKALVYVTLKPGVLDPQGKATENALHHLGFHGVSNVRIGKYIELDVAEGTTRDELTTMCNTLLANTVIESYRIELPESA